MTSRWTRRVGSFAFMLFVFTSTVFANGGCSWMFAEGPSKPKPPDFQPPPCTTSLQMPVLDTILSALFLTNFAVNATKSTQQLGVQKDLVLTVGGTMTAWTGISAAIGYSRVSACKADMAIRVTPPPPSW